jgi:hypothetical protein
MSETTCSLASASGNQQFALSLCVFDEVEVSLAGCELRECWADLVKLFWQVGVDGCGQIGTRIASHALFCSRLFVLNFLSPRLSSLVTAGIGGRTGI